MTLNYKVTLASMCDPFHETVLSLQCTPDVLRELAHMSNCIERYVLILHYMILVEHLYRSLQ